jgi:hypothetical protein
MTNGTDATTEEEIVAGEDFEPAEIPIDTAEEWATWETKLCLWSLGIGIVGLVVLGLLVNTFIL